MTLKMAWSIIRLVVCVFESWQDCKELIFIAWMIKTWLWLYGKSRTYSVMQGSFHNKTFHYVYACKVQQAAKKMQVKWGS